MIFFTVNHRTDHSFLTLWAARLFGAMALVSLLGAAVPAGLENEPTRQLIEEVDWIIEAGDSICGVREARQIKKPGVVDFDYLVGLTAEAKKIKRDKIDPNSAEGIRLMNLAKSNVRDACSAIMKRQGYDSVWKKISSRKGAQIEDVTAYVEIEINKK